MTITKAEITEAVLKKIKKITKKDAKLFVDIFFDEIKKALENDEDVKISGLGKFLVREKNARPGRNPKTGEEVTITARKVVTFHASQKLKTLVKDNVKNMDNK